MLSFLAQASSSSGECGMFWPCPPTVRVFFSVSTSKRSGKEFLLRVFGNHIHCHHHRFCHIVLFFGATKTRKVQESEPEAAILIIVPFHVSSPVDVFAYCTIGSSLLLLGLPSSPTQLNSSWLFTGTLLMNVHSITIHSQIHFERNKRDVVLLSLSCK